jgi:hypothetical protein
MFCARVSTETSEIITIDVTIIPSGLLSQVSTEQASILQAGIDFFGAQADTPTARPVAQDLLRCTPRAIAAGTSLGAYIFPAAVTLVDITLQAYTSGGDYVGSQTGEPTLLEISGATLMYALSPDYIPPTPPDFNTIPYPVTPVDTGAETPGTLYLVPDATYDVVIPTRPGYWRYDPYMDEDYWIPEEPEHTVTEPSPWEGAWKEIASKDWYTGGGFEINDRAYVNLSFAWCWGGNSTSIFTTTGTYQPSNNCFSTLPGQVANVDGNIYGRNPTGSSSSLYYYHTWQKVEIGVAYAPNNRVYWRPSPLVQPPLVQQKRQSGLANVIGLGLLAALAMMSNGAPVVGRRPRKVT